MTNETEKPGEVVQNVLENLDENGQVISRVTVAWFGFDRQNANNLTTAFVETINNLARKFSEENYGKVSTKK